MKAVLCKGCGCRSGTTPRPTLLQLAESHQIALFTREGCTSCAKIKKQLKEAGVEYAEVNLPHTIRTRVLGAIAEARTVPQLFVDGELIGGSEQTDEWVTRRDDPMRLDPCPGPHHPPD